MRWSLRRITGGISGSGVEPSGRSSRIKVGASSRTGRESTASAATRLLFRVSCRANIGLSRGARSSARRTARCRRATRRRKKKDKTNLKAGASGVALLLLGAIVGRRLATRALSSRRFALAASHCCFVGGCAGWVRGRGREKKSSRSIGAKSCAGAVDEDDATMPGSGGVVGNIDVGYGMRCRCCGGGW